MLRAASELYGYQMAMRRKDKFKLSPTKVRSPFQRVTSALLRAKNYCESSSRQIGAKVSDQSGQDSRIAENYKSEKTSASETSVHV